jgi:Cu+-exporting ATPase
MVKQRLSVDGMHCSSCSMLIDEALEDLPGVVSSTTSVRKARTDVSYDPEVTSVGVMAATLAELGYTIRPVVE